MQIMLDFTISRQQTDKYFSTTRMRLSGGMFCIDFIANLRQWQNSENRLYRLAFGEVNGEKTSVVVFLTHSVHSSTFR